MPGMISACRSVLSDAMRFFGHSFLRQVGCAVPLPINDEIIVMIPHMIFRYSCDCMLSAGMAAPAMPGMTKAADA